MNGARSLASTLQDGAIRDLRIRARFGKLAYLLRHSVQAPFYGFVHGHGVLTEDERAGVGRLVGSPAPEVILEFEQKFASLIGSGEAVAFAAARMAFFVLMKALSIGRGDEVILLGATCAVMATAVQRAGATPIYSDIDPATFGSSARHIKSRITPRTRMIVAQHSFGIPCEIEPIVASARASRIFLLEDCALTVGSKIDGTAVGNFGDAALFSTDRSKPLNTMIGGLVFTRDTGLAAELRNLQAAAPDLSSPKQRALWRRFLIGQTLYGPTRYGRLALRDTVTRVAGPRSKRPFLEEDFTVASGKSYPYPARMPAFLAAIGLAEIQRWHAVAQQRKTLLRALLDVAQRHTIASFIPQAYCNRRLDIVPLRLAWTQPNGEAMRAILSSFVDVSWTWFLQPIVGTKEPLENFSYHAGTCPVSEQVGPNMINLPCNVPVESSGDLVSLFENALLASGN